MVLSLKFDIFILTYLVVILSCTLKQTKSERLGCPPKSNNRQPINRVNTTERLAALRKLMKLESYGLDAILVTTGDEHQTETVSDDDKRREYISGFSGSSGNAIITVDKAAVWADGRYHLQADEQLDCNWLLMRDGDVDVPSQAVWLQTQIPRGGKIGADPKLVSASEWTKLESELKKQNPKFNFVEMKPNLIDLIWAKPHTEEVKRAYTLDDYYTGKKWTTKVDETIQELKKLKSDAMVVTALDEVAWLLNIRGWDIPFNGFLKSYVFLNSSDIVLYADQRKIEGNVTDFFQNNYPGKLKFKQHDDIFSDLPLYARECTTKILVPSSCSYSAGASKKIYSLVPEQKLVSNTSPIIYLKAKKNPTEILGMTKAHIRDGAALCRFFHYFESSINKGDFWDEVKVATEVDRFRLEQRLSVVPSFSTIAAFGPHSALPHYVATPSTSSVILNNNILLIDSGGQYYDGTTDVTRTVHFGIPNKEEKEAYTRVLMGNIELFSLIFPDNLNTSSMDVIARAPIWNAGYDYDHGTGHGIGSFSSVHESPVNVKYRSSTGGPLQEGYFLSNEPGIYIEGKFGIRLENIMRVVNETPSKYHGHSFLSFVEVTFVPYFSKLINLDLLTVNHKRWLNQYNDKIRKLVGEELKHQNAIDAYNWMLNNTKPV